jgi:hypothetical protein
MPFFPQFSNLFVPPYVPAPPVTPYAWYKADVGVTQSSGLVTQWNDQSGNGRHLTVPSGATEPNYISSGINSLPSIEFLSDNALQLTNDTTTIKSIISVVRSSASLSNYKCIVEAYGGGLYTIISQPNFGSYWASFVGYAAISTSTDYILSVRTDDGLDTYGYLNTTEYPAPGSGFQPRSHITVGNDSTLGQAISGYISELILFDVGLSQAQINSYISDMNTKYEIY